MNNKADDLTFKQLRMYNVIRTNISFNTVDSWSPMDWAAAMAGECGEACNIVKKIRMLQGYDGNVLPRGQAGYAVLRVQLADELGDLITYADLLAARLGIDLGMAVTEKFNKVSGLVKSKITL